MRETAHQPPPTPRPGPRGSPPRPPARRRAPAFPAALAAAALVALVAIIYAPPGAARAAEPAGAPRAAEPAPATAAPPIHIPDYDVVRRVRDAAYGLRLDLERDALLAEIEALEEPQRSAWGAVLAFLDLAANRGPDKAEDARRSAEFRARVDRAIANLERREREGRGDPQLNRLMLGVCLGMKAGAAMAVDGDYLGAYSNGKRGVDLIESLRAERPDFVDARLSGGILKVLVSQSGWLVRAVAPLVLMGGDLDGGLEDLRLVRERGWYARTEARMFQLFILWGDLPEAARADILADLALLTAQHPDNPQLHMFLANGHLKSGRLGEGHYHALLGLQKLSRLDTPFVRRNREALRAHLLRYRYRYYTKTGQWRQLLEVSADPSDASGVSATYHAVALAQLGRREEARALARSTLRSLDEARLTMPLFMAPYLLNLKPALEESLREQVLGEPAGPAK